MTKRRTEGGTGRQPNRPTYEVSEPGRITKVPDIASRVRKLFPMPIDAAQTRLVDKLLAGE